MLAEGLGAGLSFNRIVCNLLEITLLVWELSLRLSVFQIIKVFSLTFYLCIFWLLNGFFDDLTDIQKQQ